MKVANNNEEDWGLFLNFDDNGNIISSICPQTQIIIPQRPSIIRPKNIIQEKSNKNSERKNISFSCFIFNSIYLYLCSCNSSLFFSQKSFDDNFTI